MFALDQPIAEFQIPSIEPFWVPELAPRDAVALAASAVYPAGSLIGELTDAPGTFGLYAGGEVAAINVTDPGTGYTSPPTVTLTGTAGAGATATAYVSGGAVIGLVVTNGGEGYEDAPSVTLTAVNGGSGATATATVVGGAVVSLTITDAGSGYLAAPTVSFSGGGSGGATATAALGIVTVSAVYAGGSDYLVNDVLTVSGGTGTAATLTVLQVNEGAITEVAITTPGAYSVIPTGHVGVTGGAGTEATFTLVWGVTSVAVTSGGSGYTKAPAVSFSGSDGATATAVLGYADDGTQNPTAIIPYDVATDANGTIWDGLVAGVSQLGESRQSIDAFFGGYFLGSQIPNLDDNALAAMGGKVCRGLNGGNYVIKF